MSDQTGRSRFQFFLYDLWFLGIAPFLFARKLIFSNGLFKTLTLQTSHGHVAEITGGERLVIGGSMAIASSFNKTAGVLPVFEANFLVTSNLFINGLYSGFSTDGDVVILTRYGFTFMFEAPESASFQWMMIFFRSSLTGPEDFFFKTVGVEILRQINYKVGHWWIGAGSGFFDAGIHLKNSDGSLILRDHLKGRINSLCLGIDREISMRFSAGMEVKLHPSFMSMMVGLHKVIP